MRHVCPWTTSRAQTSLFLILFSLFRNKHTFLFHLLNIFLMYLISLQLSSALAEIFVISKIARIVLHFLLSALLPEKIISTTELGNASVNYLSPFMILNMLLDYRRWGLLYTVVNLHEPPLWISQLYVLELRAHVTSEIYNTIVYIF